MKKVILGLSALCMVALHLVKKMQQAKLNLKT